MTIRKARLDENGDIVTDEKGNPIYEVVPIIRVEMFDNEPVLDGNGKFITFKSDSVPFGYRTSSENTRQMGEVVYSDFRLACPMFLNPLEYGTRLTLTDYDRTYDVVVVKKTTFNLGTNVWVNEVQN